MITSRIGRVIPAVTFAIALSATTDGLSTTIDLRSNHDTALYSVDSSIGGHGHVQNFTSHPTGTGVFDPFLTVERRGGGSIEAGYNTDGHTALYLNQQRPTWNTLLRRNELAEIIVNNTAYYGFELDSNEPNAANKRNITITEVQIYTSTADNTAAVANDVGNLSALGTLRWDMSDTIILNSAVDVANGGSGFSDMMLYVPVSAFAGAGANDFIWFYNVNGSVDLVGTQASEAGFEEWRAVQGLSVPDGGSTLILFAFALMGCGLVTRRFKAAANR